MANAMRVLFISGEVAPFTKESSVANLARKLPEFVHDTGEFETRIMMPRYGIISERRNRLHEVIRLSGREIPMGDASHTLKVKVASIPGIRLQVYFMDSVHYFKRKGIVADRDGKLFEDNAERSLFFGRSALETIRNLGWRPDVVHAFGWISGLVPWLLKPFQFFAITQMLWQQEAQALRSCLRAPCRRYWIFHYSARLPA